MGARRFPLPSDFQVLTFSCDPRQGTVTTASDDGSGSADEGVTVVDSPTNCKSQSSPLVKKETA